MYEFGQSFCHYNYSLATNRSYQLDSSIIKLIYLHTSLNFWANLSLTILQYLHKSKSQTSLPNINY